MSTNPAYIKALVVLLRRNKAEDEIIQIADWSDFQDLRDSQLTEYPAPRGWQDRVGYQSRDERGRYMRD